MTLLYSYLEEQQQCWSFTTRTFLNLLDFLQKSGSKITCIISGDGRQREEWVVLMCVYVFGGKLNYHDRLFTLFAKLNVSNRHF